MEQTTVLLVEDEPTLAMIIKETLEEQQEFVIRVAHDGEEGLRMFAATRPDVLVADVMMPRMDGFELVRRIRQNDKHTPVLFLTARSGIQDVVEGFKLGGNDYLKKPFGMQELIIRIKALVGRAYTPIPSGADSAETHRPNRQYDYFEIGDYLFYPVTQQLIHTCTSDEGYTVSPSGSKETALSHRESEILRRLCENRDRVVEMRAVLLELWGDDSFFNQRSLHVFITKLRRKLNQDKRIRIVNVRSIGYKLIVN